MRTFAICAAMLAMAAVAAAQGDYAASRVGASADQIRRATSQLAQQATNDLMRSAGNSRTAVQDALLAAQADSAAALLVDMVRNRRPSADLREVGSHLADLGRRAPSYSPQSSQWRQVRTAVDDFNRTLGGGSSPGPGPRPVIGQVSWRGRVDDRVQLAIRGKSIEMRTISGAQNPDGVATFTSALPDHPVEVSVTKLSGRGTARVLQQPSSSNNFTAVIEIYDNGGGAQEYRLEIVWR
jgi:hypothetical protein